MTEPNGPDFKQIAEQMIDDLRTNGTVPGIDVGDPAPLFTLPDATGNPVALADRLADGPVVVVFYRGEWCPFCNLHLRAIEAHLDEITALSASVIAVSPQAPDSSLAISEKLSLGFDVVSDADQATIRAYRLQFELPAELRGLYRDLDMALDEQNANGSWTLPVPATFVIDTTGIVRARHVDPNYRERMAPEDIVSALRGLDTANTGLSR